MRSGPARSCIPLEPVRRSHLDNCSHSYRTLRGLVQRITSWHLPASSRMYVNGTSTQLASRRCRVASIHMHSSKTTWVTSIIRARTRTRNPSLAAGRSSLTQRRGYTREGDTDSTLGHCSAPTSWTACTRSSASSSSPCTRAPRPLPPPRRYRGTRARPT